MLLRFLHPRSLYHHSISIFLLVTFASIVQADAPFITDDPDISDVGQLQLYFYSTVQSAKHTNQIIFPALEIDYGFVPNVELHLQIPILTFIPQRVTRAAGLSDIEASFKYQFIDETTYFPSVAIVPTIELPTGDASRNLGNGRPWYKLPFWFGKVLGKWATYGGWFSFQPGYRYAKLFIRWLGFTI
ncbi:MAG: hypothetical protein H0W64_07315 [Gammaproteobacteria bacterium]|nr:hypothetical protein [Gammaproteobacteria bacterium]